jgi:hypothetical protein
MSSFARLLDLSEIKVDVRDLRERQRKWGPENF